MKKIISALIIIVLALNLSVITAFADTAEEEIEARHPQGDVDGNGKIDATDYILIKRHILNISILSAEQFMEADMDANGVINSTDYIIVKRKILGIGEKEQGQQSEFLGRAFIIFTDEMAEYSDVQYYTGDDLYTPFVPNSSHNPFNKTKKLTLGSKTYSLSYYDSIPQNFCDHQMDIFVDSTGKIYATYSQKDGSLESLIIMDDIYKVSSSKITTEKKLLSVCDSVIKDRVSSTKKYDISIVSMKYNADYEPITTEGFSLPGKNEQPDAAYMVTYTFKKDGIPTSDIIEIIIDNEGYLYGLSYTSLKVFDSVSLKNVDLDKYDALAETAAKKACEDVRYYYTGCEKEVMLVKELDYYCLLYCIVPEFTGDLPENFYAAPFYVFIPVIKA